ncbi:MULTISPECIES: hypothetical protein [Nocardia]|uniref:DNA primase n=1 Tax=Nocardia implantans TaxID=3108168 RepID=A0ABU6B397_9NOCA|nr:MULTISPECIES: hypothetical protein [unclassified Nocardia]MBF6194817.1 hypothetical protein [Nocardia beijingensis]MEA3530525.1 hypothetical protein [Nocardia sp. CDC192]MEB3514201.1 hypothetical protein [Nocardia sp. CDC186]
MKGGGRIALGVGIGYLLGRTRKMRFALSLAGAAMARRSAGGPGDLIGRGTELLKSTPELTRITDTVRDELLGAARAAAVTAASNRIDALSNRLQQGATLLADQDRGGSRATDSDEGEYDQESDEYEEPASEDENEELEAEYEDEASEDEDRAPDDEYEDQAPEDVLEAEYEDEDQAPEDEDEDRAPGAEASDQDAEEDDTERPAARGHARRSSTTAKRGASSRAADRSPDSADRKPSGTRGRRTRAEAGQAPVRRTRR